MRISFSGEERSGSEVSHEFFRRIRSKACVGVGAECRGSINLGTPGSNFRRWPASCGLEAAAMLVSLAPVPVRVSMCEPIGRKESLASDNCDHKEAPKDAGKGREEALNESEWRSGSNRLSPDHHSSVMPSDGPPLAMRLTPEDVQKAHTKIADHIHRTPVLTCRTLDRIASTPAAAADDQQGGSETSPAAPRLRLYFKCENFQKIGAFKARGAFHALACLVEGHGLEELKRRGVVAHSSGGPSERERRRCLISYVIQLKTFSLTLLRCLCRHAGNHAQALAFAASQFGVPAYIVMPSITAPSKIAGTKLYTEHVTLTEPTMESREAATTAITERTGAILIPPFNDRNIMLGQGTCALELDQQACGELGSSGLNLVIAPLGGGGLLSGTATYFAHAPDTYVFGAEPSYQGGDDGKRGFEAQPPTRIEQVHTRTIADGLQTPVGPLPFSFLTSSSSSATKPRVLEGIRSVTEEQIKSAMKLVLERLKVVVEPSGCVGLAALLYDEEFRAWIAHQQQQQGDGVCWDVGVILSGGNTTVEAIAQLFGKA